jgi:putative FmdB family regulatory protein
MPIYVYECEKCHKRAEYLQSMSDPAKTECEHCQGPLQRVITGTAFHLKGGGWYKDLYSSTPSSGDSSSSSSSSGSSSTTKTESTSTSTSTTTKSDGGGGGKAD